MDLLGRRLTLVALEQPIHNLLQCLRAKLGKIAVRFAFFEFGKVFFQGILRYRLAEQLVVPSRQCHAMIPGKTSRTDLTMQLAVAPGLHEFELEGLHDGLQMRSRLLYYRTKSLRLLPLYPLIEISGFTGHIYKCRTGD